MRFEPSTHTQLASTSPSPTTAVDRRTWDDDVLLAASQAGDDVAFQELMARHTGRVWRVAAGILRDNSEVDDVVQQTFINVHRGLASFRSSSRPGTWIYRIAVNTALMRRRKLQRLRETPMERPMGDDGDHVLVEAADHTTPWESYERTELRTAIADAASQLDEKYRVVFQMRDVDGLSITETATALGMTEAAIKTRLHRARAFLRDALAGYVAA